MDAKTQSKIRTHIILLSAFASLALILIAVIAIIGFKSIVGDNFNANYISEKSTYLSSVRLSFEETRTLSRDLIIYSGDSEYISQIKDKIVKSMENINYSLDAYKSFVIMMEEYEKTETVSDLFSRYNRSLSHMIELGMSGDKEAIVTLSSEADDLAVKISSDLQAMSDLAQALQMEYADSMEHGGNTIIVTLISVTVMVLIIIVFVSIFIIINISKIMNATSDQQEPIGIIQEQNYNSYSDNSNLMLSDFKKCVLDLKAITHDLSEIAKEFKR